MNWRQCILKCITYVFAERFLLGGSKPYCHDKLGCFPLTGDFAERPVGFNPNSRETVNTQFNVSLSLTDVPLALYYCCTLSTCFMFYTLHFTANSNLKIKELYILPGTETFAEEPRL